MSRPQKGKPDRDVMLSQAEALFAEVGFGACSLRDVMGAMKCSTTAFYARFDSKNDVFEDLVQELVSDLHDRASGALSAVRSIDDGFRVGIEVLVETIIPRKPLVSVALSEGTAIAGIRAILQESFGLMAAMTEHQFELIGATSPRSRAWALIGAIHMQVLRWAVFEEIADDALAAAIHDATRPLVP